MTTELNILYEFEDYLNNLKFEPKYEYNPFYEFRNSHPNTIALLKDFFERKVKGVLKEKIKELEVKQEAMQSEARHSSQA